MAIDGVKIRCIGTHFSDWESNSLLSFSTKVDEQTGEIKSDTKTAYYRGLHFHLIPSTIKDEVHCILRGSLAKYYNNGLHNAFDYNLQMVGTTIKDLQQKFNINPFTSIVQHVEVGVNINTSQSPKTIIRGLRAFQSDCFTALRLDEVFNGREIKKQEYSYKVYDKGLQLKKKHSSLLRVELAIKSTKKAKKYGIEVLADLVEVEKINKIKLDILEVWKDMIFYDSGMRWKIMNKKQREKMLFYLDATNWEKFNRKQRFRAKTKYTELTALFGTSKTQAETLNLISRKLDDLTAKKGNALRFFLKENESQKRERFTDLDKPVNRGQNDNLKQVPKKEEKSVKINLIKCKTCSTDISHKKTGSIYCSKKCNNADQAKRRKKKRRQNRTIEKKQLQKLLKRIAKSKLLITIRYIKNNRSSNCRYQQSDIIFSMDLVASIQEINISAPETITLTSYRARKLIKSIIQNNQVNHLK